MPLTLPATGKPRLTSEQLTKRFKSLKTFELAKHPLVVAGVRGYYKNAMGALVSMTVAFMTTLFSCTHPW
jgi:hypothetical protein